MAIPLFSVIIPSYSRPTMLADAVDSVLGQTVDSFECLVIDDASPEPVIAPSDPRVTVVRRDSNGGTAASRNTGLDAATGRYVTFLDDDDVFTPDRLELALAGLDRADIAVCWSHFMDGPQRPGRSLDGDVRDVLLEDIVPNVAQAAMVREGVPRFDERLRCSEDVEWWIRTCQQLELVTTPQWGVEIRRHGGRQAGKSFAQRADARTTILGWHDDFFTPRPRSGAFQWRRIGLLRAAAGEHKAARAALRRSMRLDPKLRTLRHLVRPARGTRSGDAAT